MIHFSERMSSKIKSPFATATASVTAIAIAQTGQNPRPPEQSDDVIRVYTDLVQTDLMVFDKQGRFVNGLKQEDFALRIDGKSRSISFFESVAAGSGSEEPTNVPRAKFAVRFAPRSDKTPSKESLAEGLRESTHLKNYPKSPMTRLPTVNFP